MQIIAPILAVAGIAAAMPGDPGYKPKEPSYQPPNAYSPPEKHCITSSTCSASYHTTTKWVPYEKTKTVTLTSYTPKVYSTKVEKNYTVTNYGMSML